jgi:hydrogenase small subunit
MPGFPDKFTPFYKKSPGSTVSTTASRMVGSFIKPLRQITNTHLHREVRWDLHDDVPTGWARNEPETDVADKVIHHFYDKVRRSTDTSKRKGRPWGKRDEWTYEREPQLDESLPGGSRR